VISLLEIAERAYTGSKMAEKNWNLGMFRMMQELVQTYQLAVKDIEQVYEVDNSYADRLFDAAVTFLCQMGVYCVSTKRQIIFTEEEVWAACREAPSAIRVGQGHEQRTLTQREIDDRRLPNIIAGGHSAWNEALIPLEDVIKELVRIPRVDCLEGFNYHQVMGREVHGTPMIVYAARKAIERARLGLQLAGRAGLALCYYPILTTAAAFIAPKDEQRGLRWSDGLLLSVLPDLKVETDLIAAALYYEEYGCFRQNGGTGGTVGGFAGGWEGAMIESVVRNIVAWMVYHDAIQYASGVGLMRHAPYSPTMRTGQAGPTTELAQKTWCGFAVQQALRRHKHTITSIDAGTRSTTQDDPTTRETLLATALSSIEGTVLGQHLRCLWTPSPSIVQWVIDVSDATLRGHITLKQVEYVLHQLRTNQLAGYDASRDRRMLLYSDPYRFFHSHQLAYDYTRQQPTPRFLNQRNEAIEYLETLGLKFT
jgi:methylamine--corrinoid protein Co-methyltransferase